MFYNNLSRVIRWYKGRASFEIRKICPAFCWQSRFYDHIIQNDKALHAISKYIKKNPSKWKD